MTHSFTIALSCPERRGITAAVTQLLFDVGGNVGEAQQFADAETDTFFMRILGEFPDLDSADQFRTRLSDMASEYSMKWSIRNVESPMRVLLFVSKFDHCLGDLLYRYRIGELKMDVVGIVSNHPKEALNLTTFGDIPYWHLPVSAANKGEQEAKIKQLVEESDVDLVVLARYMQILSDDLSNFLSGRCINIHHSFLPGFKGARPYHQAHSRGVKMIGATAHYVTPDLDEGPIICQDVEAISHADRPDDLVRKGRDIERRVLARAVHLHLESRVLLNGAKTVVFED